MKFDWKTLTQIFSQQSVMNNMVASIVFVIIVVVLRRVVLSSLGLKKFSTDESKLRWHVRLRNLSVLFVLFGLITIWASQLQTFAISAVAFAAALVVATKELIMCISGGFLRMTSEGFKVGDRIEVGSNRGEVINIGFLTTTLLEIGPGHHRTGRALIVPNSLFVTSSVINETFTENYVLHILQVPITIKDRWEDAEAILLDSARKVCASYQEEATRHLTAIAQKNALTASSSEPKVLVQMKSEKVVLLLLRFPTSARDKGRHEQEVLRLFLTAYQTMKAEQLDVVQVDEEDEDDASDG